MRTFDSLHFSHPYLLRLLNKFSSLRPQLYKYFSIRIDYQPHGTDIAFGELLLFCCTHFGAGIYVGGLQNFLNVEVNDLIQLRLHLPQDGLLLDLIAVAGAEIVDIAVGNALVVHSLPNERTALAEAKANHTFIPESGNWNAFKRCIGVVVNKYKKEYDDTVITGKYPPHTPRVVLDVMFEEDGEYSIRKFGIEMEAVFFDDKEFVPVYERKVTKTGHVTEKVTGPTTSNDITGPTVSKVTGPTTE